jgi:ACS family pantothenate transporter-like MFS transporter
MKEDLALYGKELNYATAIWSAAYVFGQIPSNLLLTRVGREESPSRALY